jgi:NADPH2:quinone reductase
MRAALPTDGDGLTAAALPLAGMTALRLLRAAGALTGTRILITGASGGVGRFVTELASAAGAEVTVVSASPKRSARLKALGATSAVSDLAAARGPFDVIMESVGGDWLPRALALTRKGGQLL